VQAPDATAPFPIAEHRRVGFIKNFVTRPNIVVGDYSYTTIRSGLNGLRMPVSSTITISSATAW
jgi:hypothetical protein